MSKMKADRPFLRLLLPLIAAALAVQPAARADLADDHFMDPSPEFADMEGPQDSNKTIAPPPLVTPSPQQAMIQKGERQQAAEQQMELKMRVAQADAELRSQMSMVVNWLEQYMVQNQSRFPGAVNNEMDEMYAAQVQLTQMLPNNPYSPGLQRSAMNLMGMPMDESSDGSDAAGAPVWGDNWTNHLAAQKIGRVQLQVDLSLSRQEINGWSNYPPDTWQAKPGTITAIGNNQGLFMVWGAGADGKPIKDSLTGKTEIMVGRSWGTMDDQAAPNEE